MASRGGRQLPVGIHSGGCDAVADVVGRRLVPGEGCHFAGCGHARQDGRAQRCIEDEHREISTGGLIGIFGVVPGRIHDDADDFDFRRCGGGVDSRCPQGDVAWLNLVAFIVVETVRGRDEEPWAPQRRGARRSARLISARVRLRRGTALRFDFT